MVTLALLGVGIWGTIELEVRFESVWFLPPSSYLAKWYSADEEFFPSEGEVVTVYMTELDYPGELDKIEDLVYSLDNATDIVASTNSWWPEYKDYLNNNLGLGENGKVTAQIVLNL